MDPEFWGIVIPTGVGSSLLVVLLILLINTWGRRAQALTWLPLGLLSTLTLQYAMDKDTLPSVIGAAFAAQFVSAVFIITFHFTIKFLLESKMKWKNATMFAIVLVAVAAGVTVVWYITHNCSYDASFILGVTGVVATILFIKRDDAKLDLGKEEYSCSFNKCCPKGKIGAEVGILLTAGIGTFLFILIPALWSAACCPEWSGIFANMPKVTIIVMISLWIRIVDDEDIADRKHELEEHLLMFAYSSCIGALFLFTFGHLFGRMGEFVLSVVVSTVLILITIAVLLEPFFHCCAKQKVGDARGQPQNEPGGPNAAAIKEWRPSPQGAPKLRF